MDPLVPWLLLLIAGLVLACAAMHSRLREVESTTNARQSLVADELRDAEAALLAALDRLRRMDQSLAERESRLCEPVLQPPPQAGSSSVPRAVAESAPLSEVAVSRARASTGTSGPSRAAARLEPEPPRQRSVLIARRDQSPRHPRPPADWRVRAVEMAGSGLNSRQIARELELPVGEVELILALGS